MPKTAKKTKTKVGTRKVKKVKTTRKVVVKKKEKVRKIAKKRKGKARKFEPIAAKPLTEEQIQAFVAHFNKNGSFPGNKIPCSVTGKLTTAVGPWLRLKVKEYGSAEKFLRGYKCRGALKAERPPKEKKVSKRAIRAAKREAREKKKEMLSTPLQLPNSPPRPLTKKEWIEESRSVCLRPSIFLDNGRHCEGCPFYDFCENRNKKLPKGCKFKDGKFVY